MTVSRTILKFANLLTVVHCFTAPSMPTTTTRCSTALQIEVPDRGSDTRISDTAEILDAEFTFDADSKEFNSFEKRTPPPFKKQKQPNNNDDEFGKEYIWAKPNDLYTNTQKRPNNVNFGPEEQWATQNDFWYEQNYSRRGSQQRQPQKQWGQEEWGAASNFYNTVKENHSFDHDRWDAQPFGYYTHEDQQKPNKDTVATDKEPQKSADPSVQESSTAIPEESALSNDFDEDQRAYQEHLLIHEMTRHIDKLNKENARLRDTVETLNNWDAVTMTWEIANFDRRLTESRTTFSSDEFEIGGYTMKLELNVFTKEESKGEDREIGFYFYNTGGSVLMPIEMEGSKVTVIGAPSSDLDFADENNLKSFEAAYGFKIEASRGGFGWSEIATLQELRHGGYLTVEGSLVIEALVRIKKVRRS
eukprot:CAMPEP_0194253186 /NCGR_PEP_ID=MMETSP0158-20130606/29409_1 /TAXON_ID=33649 /ORGANISM="Thalassionema nitzschioides, Strain L26-B" /LENGTH=417 /DNA_ID=CAMNT_0038990819 /DNA_START=89 /DNA_END=1339 /DNA_ORIENTATION=-